VKREYHEAIVSFLPLLVSLSVSRRRAYDVSVSAEIGGPQAHHSAQVDVAGRQDVPADLRVRAAAGKSIRRGDTLAGAPCTALRLYRALQTFRLFLISYSATRICVEDRLESHQARTRGKIRTKRYRIALVSHSVLLLKDVKQTKLLFRL